MNNSFVQSYFDGLNTVIKQKIGLTQYSIILCGSLARDEGSIVQLNNNFELLSDIEYFLIGEFNRIQRREINFEITQYNKKYQNQFSNPFFHIDYVILNKNSITKLDTKFHTFETKSSGKTIYGEDLIPSFPEVNLKNLKWEDINDILIHRLFSVFYYGSKLEKSMPLFSIYKNYLIARNALDLLSVFLPYNGYLISGYQARYNVLQEHFKRNGDITGNLIQDDFFDLMDLALQIKFNPTLSPQDPPRLLEKFMSYTAIFRDKLCRKKIFYRRQLGIIKRSIIKKRLPARKKTHFNNLFRDVNSLFLTNDQQDSDKNKKNYDKNILTNGILYGYPRHNDKL